MFAKIRNAYHNASVWTHHHTIVAALGLFLFGSMFWSQILPHGQTYADYTYLATWCGDNELDIDVSLYECEQLVQLYIDSDGDNWNNTQNNNAPWFQSTTLCDWYGLTCNGVTVDIINLQANNLQGSISIGLTGLNQIFLNSNQLTSIDVSGLNNLETLYAYNNQLTNIDVTGLPSLVNLILNGNQLATVNLSGLTNLSYLDLHGNQFTSIDISSLTNIIDLNINDNQLTSIDFSGLTGVHTLQIADNGLATIDLTGLTSISFLDIRNNQLTSIDVSGLTGLIEFYISNNQLSTINLNGLTNLMNLRLESNLLTNIDVSGLTNLPALYLDNNQLTSIDVSGLTGLNNIYLNNNQLTTVNLTGLTSVSWLDIRNNQLTSIDLSGLTGLNILLLNNNQLTSIDLFGLNNLSRLYLSNNQLTNIDVSGLTGLIEFYISNNKLTSLGEELIDFQDLSLLDISNNCIDIQSLSTQLIDLIDSLMGDTYWQSVQTACQVLGCTDPSATNYNPSAEYDDNSCTYPSVGGCTDPSATNYNPSAEYNDNSCMYPADPIDPGQTTDLSITKTMLTPGPYYVGMEIAYRLSYANNSENITNTNIYDIPEGFILDSASSEYMTAIIADNSRFFIPENTCFSDFANNTTGPYVAMIEEAQEIISIREGGGERMGMEQMLINEVGYPGGPNRASFLIDALSNFDMTIEDWLLMNFNTLHEGEDISFVFPECIIDGEGTKLHVFPLNDLAAGMTGEIYMTGTIDDTSRVDNRALVMPNNGEEDTDISNNIAINSLETQNYCGDSTINTFYSGSRVGNIIDATVIHVFHESSSQAIDENTSLFSITAELSGGQTAASYERSIAPMTGDSILTMSISGSNTQETVDIVTQAPPGYNWNNVSPGSLHKLSVTITTTAGDTITSNTLFLGYLIVYILPGDISFSGSTVHYDDYRLYASILDGNIGNQSINRQNWSIHNNNTSLDVKNIFYDIYNDGIVDIDMESLTQFISSVTHTYSTFTGTSFVTQIGGSLEWPMGNELTLIDNNILNGGVLFTTTAGTVGTLTQEQCDDGPLGSPTCSTSCQLVGNNNGNGGNSGNGGNAGGAGGGGAGVTLETDTDKNICEIRDCSDSYYDGECGVCDEKQNNEEHKSADEKKLLLIDDPVAFQIKVLEVMENMKSNYQKEMVDGYVFARDVQMTTIDNIDEAMLMDPLIRKHAAKIISMYAVEVLGLKPDLTRACIFDDMTNESFEMQSFARLACQLGIMGLEADGQTVAKAFNPDDIVTRNQFGTMLSRVLYEGKVKPNDTDTCWYCIHLETLKKNKIMNQITNPQMEEIRGYVMLMMMRSYLSK